MNSRVTHILTFGAGFLAGGLSTYYYGRYQCRKLREQREEREEREQREQSNNSDEHCSPNVKVMGKVVQV